MLGHIALYKYIIIIIITIIIIIIIINIIIKICLFHGQKELSRFQARLSPYLKGAWCIN